MDLIDVDYKGMDQLQYHFYINNVFSFHLVKEKYTKNNQGISSRIFSPFATFGKKKKSGFS
jgi:hypothetical protein